MVILIGFDGTWPAKVGDGERRFPAGGGGESGREQLDLENFVKKLSLGHAVANGVSVGTEGHDFGNGYFETLTSRMRHFGHIL